MSDFRKSTSQRHGRIVSMPLVLCHHKKNMLQVTITNVASNTATANVLVPILAKMAITMCINPIYLTLPAGEPSTLPIQIQLFSRNRKTSSCFRNRLLLCLCPACSHSTERHCVRSQQHEDDGHDEGGICDELDLRDHPRRVDQQLRGATFRAG